MLYCNSIMARLQHHLGILSLSMPLIGITAGALEWNSAAIFALNIVGVIPLGLWINRSVDALAVGRSRVVNEVLKSTLGNSVELMVISSPGGTRSFIQTLADHLSRLESMRSRKSDLKSLSP